jgi:pyruvate formate lyase activating enzyme
MTGNFNSSRIVEALLQEPLGDGRVRCHTCHRQCVIGEGKTGWCRTRMVRGGRLYTLTYGRVSSLASNPIEKKPLYHFYPGSHALTAGSWSCNFTCPWCQNWHLSKSASGSDRFMTPAAFVEETLRCHCQGTSISFNEPTLSLEWSLEVFRTARNAKPPLYNTFVTNGYMTSDALKLLAEAGLDALNIDIKGDAATCQRYCQADVAQVWENCKLARQLGLHLEITTLVIPGVNDDDESLRGIASRIASELGRDVPWHVNAYCPAYRFNAPPTPTATMTRA